jgi:hypothetical protein
VDSSAHDELSRASLEALDEAFFRMKAVRDENGHITDFEYQYCNRTALCVLGRSGEEVFGRGLLELYPTHVTNGLFDSYVHVTETGEPLRYEFCFDESGLAGEFEVLVSRFGDGYILVGHDITSRKRDERKLTVLADQLQGALTSRVAIEQAKGYLAAKFDMDTTTAFHVIRRYARDHNQRLHDVAEAIVAGQLDLADKGKRRK